MGIYDCSINNEQLTMSVTFDIPRWAARSVLVTLRSNISRDRFLCSLLLSCIVKIYLTS